MLLYRARSAPMRRWVTVVLVQPSYYHKFIHSESSPQKTDSGAPVLHNNAHPHIARPVVNLFIDYTWKTLHHPPYSPDSSVSDFDLFPKLKEPLCGTCSGSLDELSLAMTREICHLNKEWLLNRIWKLLDRW